MDHLPVPNLYSALSLEVECLSKRCQDRFQYDNLGFQQFLSRHNFSQNELRRRIVKSRCQSEATPSFCSRDTAKASENDLLDLRSRHSHHLLQEWCWFGLLHEISMACEVPIAREEVLRRTDNGLYVLDTTALLDYPQKVAQRLRHNNSEYAGMVLARQHDYLPGVTLLSSPKRPDTGMTLATTVTSDLAGCIRTIRGVLGWFYSYEGAYTSIIVSIVVLLHAAEYLAENILGYRPSPSINFAIDQIHGTMIQNSWCPSRLGPLSALDAGCAYIASLLPSHDFRSHSDAYCTEDRCKLLPAAEADVLPLHVDDCLCQYDTSWCEIPEKGLIQIWLSGGIPGLWRRSQFVWEVKDVSAMSYVAISHVWSHGLGNTRNNALPVCQLERLFGYLHEIGQGSTCLWIDTLSVPVTDEAKLVVLPKLIDLYTRANKVLIVDRYLTKVSDNGTERRLQLLLSDWRTRLWALQEGRLAGNLWVRFATAAVPVIDLIESEGASSTDDSLGFLDATHKSLADALTPLFAQEHDRTRRFANLLHDCSFRQVTKATDETICLATLLGVDISKLNDLLTMENILHECQHSIPEDIIFVPGRKLRTRSFRWAPRSLLAGERWVINCCRAGPLGSNGILVQKDVVRLQTIAQPTVSALKTSNRMRQRLILTKQTSTLPSAHIGTKWRPGLRNEAANLYVASSDPAHKNVPQGSTHFSFEFANSTDDIGMTGLANRMIILKNALVHEREVSRGVLVDVINHDEGGVFYCIFRAHLWCWTRLHRPFNPREERPLANIIHMQCDVVREQQVWVD